MEAIVKRFTRLIVTGLLSACLLPACSVLNSRTPVQIDVDAENGIADDFERSRLIALDLVNALVQIPTLRPASTTLHTARPRSRFGELLVASLQDAGYDLRIGDKASAGWLNYSIEPVSVVAPAAPVPGTADYTFMVSAGSVKVKRTYRVDSLGVRPASSLFVHGGDGSGIRLHDALFDRLSTGIVSASDKPFQVAGKRAVANQAVTNQAAANQALENRAAVKGLPPVVKKNMYETRRSNFESLLQNYDSVRSEVLIFPNDSLVMGASNKRIAREIVASFDPGSDVISVIGCSHGKTSLVKGNQKLALGRSYRVKEELILAGIAADKILEEGCWANVHFDQEMPRRGVVVTHKRRSN
jgi:outer membrane protein OmpA-like peptidoglycan-associated protein